MKALVQVLLSAAFFSTIRCDFLRVCYYRAEAHFRDNVRAKMEVSDIDPTLCTHLVYAYAKLDETNKTVVTGFPDEEEGGNGMYAKFNNFKNKHNGLKTILSVGGRDQDAPVWAKIAGSEEDVVKKFASSAVTYLKRWRFDGMDVAFSCPTDNMHLVTILKSLREAFDQDGSGLILSVPMSPKKATIDKFYSIEKVHPLVDFISLMAFDFNEQQDGKVAFNSPLYPREDFNEELCVSWAVEEYLEDGVPESKLVVGFTWRGIRITLQDRNKHIPGSEANYGDKIVGEWYGGENTLAWPEICEMQKDTSAEMYWDEEQASSYMVLEDSFVNYDDNQSIIAKLKYLWDKEVRGVMVMFLDEDDFSGTACNNGTYPLMNAMMDELEREGLIDRTADSDKPGDDGDDGGGDLSVSRALLPLCCLLSLWSL